MLGSADALGIVDYIHSSLPDAADLTVDDCGVLDLNGQDPTVTSLNSSFAGGATNGKITNGVNGNPGFATLTVEVGGNPGLFAGKIVERT